MPISPIFLYFDPFSKKHTFRLLNDLFLVLDSLLDDIVHGVEIEKNACRTSRKRLIHRSF
jgi:hypothetical protein